MGNKRIDEPTGTETVGHEWDGIEELNTPLPRWWLWTFYATCIWALIYVVLYPAWPLIDGATQGVLGWSSRGELQEEMAEAEVDRAPILNALARVPVERLPDDSARMQAAVAGGRAAFKVHCVQCHGSGAAGYQDLGYPNLNDDDWIWGGDLRAIEYTLVNGIRHPGDDETRFSLMPAFGRDGLLDAGQIDAVTDHVLSLSGKAQPNPTGAELYANNCAACHGPQGTGDRQFGAPNLADAIWLYGDDRAQIERQIHEPRHGVMPAWEDRLDPVTIKMLAAYVHSLGGGEDFVEVAEEPGVEIDDVP